MITYGTFEKGNPLEDEEALLKIVEDGDSSVLDKTTFKFENNQLSFSKDVNAEKSDAELNHAIEETPLSVSHD